jgi:hypothetical protein
MKRVTPIRIAIGLAILAAIAVGVWTFRGPRVVVRTVCQSDRDDAVRVLFIGNSHTFVNDLPTVLCGMGAASQPPVPLAVTEVVAPGYTLDQHLREGSAGRAVIGSRWTWVVLQEQSQTPFIDREGFDKSVHAFDALIQHAHAKTAVFALPPRRDARQNADAVEEAYAQVAAEVGATVVPVGKAWMRAIAARPDVELYQADGYHPRPEGTYLGACVFYAKLTGRSPVGLPSHASSIALDASLAAALQGVVADLRL